ncbi:hypothetical protein, partial [Bartonella sp. CL45QHWL]|uniref:hypothetical protein n=1 Tax=Bartonella sp. CL45QHWL TaxID=3243533 RepID=UPI0035D04BD4
NCLLMGDSDVKSTWRKYWGEQILKRGKILKREKILKRRKILGGGVSKYWEISAVADQKTNDTKGVLNAKKSNGVGRKNHL